MKNYKYSPIVKVICFILSVICSYSFAVNTFSLIRKEVYFNGVSEKSEFTKTWIFNENISDVISHITNLAYSSDKISQETNFKEFIESDEICVELTKSFEKKKSDALYLFEQIQILKQLEPNEDGSYYDSEYELYYAADDSTYTSLDDWYSEKFINWQGNNSSYTEVYNPNDKISYSNDKYDDNTEVTTMVSVENAVVPTISVPVITDNKKYYTHAEWEKEYQDLRNAIFSIVADATSKQTITEELDYRLNERLIEEYELTTSETILDFTENAENIKYYLVNKKTGYYFTNLENKKEIEAFKNNYKNNSLYYFYSDGKKSDFTNTEIKFEDNIFNNILNIFSILKQINYEFVINTLSENNCELYLKITEPKTPDDISYSIFNTFNSTINKNSDGSIFYLTSNLILSVLFIIVLIVFSKAKEKNGKKLLNIFDKAPFILKLAFYCFVMISLGTAVVFLFLADFEPQELIMNESFKTLINCKSINFLTGLCFALATAFTIDFALYIARNVKSEQFKKRFIIYLIFTFFKKSGNSIKFYFSQIKNLNKLVLIGVPAYLIILCVFSIATVLTFVYFGLAGFIILIPTLGLFISAILFILKIVPDFFAIIKAVEKLKDGNLDFNLESYKFIFFLREFAENLNKCRDSIQNAVNEQIKGEKLKTELITNVSHDLKTPLTSIINYVSLLKLSENIKGEEELKYIDILDEKSTKLKRLIEDLTEASKASSGNIKMNLDIVNLNELSLQAVGESSDILENVGLEIILSQKEDELFVKADSQHTFRIFDNLFSNAKKYALTGTRVYVDIYKENEFGVISIKNISKDKLNIDPNELTERFVRGDNSRTSEGSGLGLSIVRSFTELQNGKFNIEIDGDLFKVTVKLPLTNKPLIQNIKNTETTSVN